VNRLLYEEFLVRKNLVPNPLLDALLYFERGELKKRIERLITALLKVNSRAQIVIYGPHQSGKTHLLAFLRNRIFSESQMRCLEVDFIFARVPFQLYSQILNSLMLNGCMDAFLEFVVKPNGLPNLRQLTGASSVIATVFTRVSRDPKKLREWLNGNLVKQGESWMPDIKDAWIEIDVLTNLLRFYYAFFQKQLYPVLIADHCEILFDDLITYINEDNRVHMAKLLCSVMDLSSFFLSIESDKIDGFNRILHPKSAAFENLELPPLQEKDIGEFIMDARNSYVDPAKTKTLSDVKLDEHLTSASYPLTSEAEKYLLSMFPLEPGKLVKILQKSLNRSVQDRQEYFISKKDLEKTVSEILPTLFFKCTNCGSKLPLLVLKTSMPTGSTAGTIRRATCPFCGTNASHLVNFLPNTLYSLVLDTSSLAGLDFSALCNWIPQLKTRRIKVFVPTAVLSEMSAWDKKEEKRIVSRLARQEYQMLVGLDSAGRIELSEVGRNPTMSEIKEASSFNSIDRIIIDIAELYDATLLTHDKDMASNSLRKARFTILFRPQ